MREYEGHREVVGRTEQHRVCALLPLSWHSVERCRSPAECQRDLRSRLPLGQALRTLPQSFRAEPCIESAQYINDRMHHFHTLSQDFCSAVDTVTTGEPRTHIRGVIDHFFRNLCVNNALRTHCIAAVGHEAFPYGTERGSLDSQGEGYLPALSLPTLCFHCRARFVIIEYCRLLDSYIP